MPSQVLIYPLPGIPTTFEAYIVGPGLRAADPENGFTADMCIPIFPTTAHPNNRQAVLPQTRFPFPNCYHWATADILIRVASGEFPGPDSPRLTRLAAGEEARMGRFMMMDQNVATFARRTREGTVEDYDSVEDGLANVSKVPEDLPIVTVSVDLSESFDQADLPDPVEFRVGLALLRSRMHGEKRRWATIHSTTKRSPSRRYTTRTTIQR